jgi:hypothetical protein
MDASYDTISAVLFMYAAFSKTERKVFMRRLNHFMFVSPQQQRRIADDWLRSCQDSANPAARVIAETAAVYGIESKKSRRVCKRGSKQ